MRYFIGMMLVLHLFVSGCKSRAAAEPINEDLIPVTTLSLQKDTLLEEVYTSGQFTTNDESNLSFKSGGIINKVWVQEGDPVKKGQLLATLNLTEVKALSEQAMLAYQKAERDYQRASNLYRDSVATLEQMQNARTAMEVAKQQYASAGFNQRHAEIRALKNGYVLKKFLNEGQYASAGSPVLQVNGTTAGGWILKAGVSDRQWALISIGDGALITTDALPGRQLEGFVIRKSEGVDPLSGTFNIQISLSGAASGGLASGLFGKAVIKPAQKQVAWSLPYDALLDGDADSGFVFITNDNKTVRKVKVTIGTLSKGQVLVTGGLENAGAVIVSGSAYLTEGSSIQVKNNTH